ncbi:uncharacterized protein [Epargyreus clarus]|uniref:uncharacterized protein n=1 Tax=Epargyreus clarus TaxID=520877 RepID=UPI003C2C2E27
MEHAPILTLVVITLLQLCRAQSSSSTPEWYAANDINDTNFSPKPITELFSTETSFSPENPIVVLPPTSPTILNRGVVSSPTPITQYSDPPNVIPLSTELPSSPPLLSYSRPTSRETQSPSTQSTTTEITSTTSQPTVTESTLTSRNTQAQPLPNQTPSQIPNVVPQNVQQNNQPQLVQNRIGPQLPPQNIQFLLPAQVGNRNFIPGQQIPPNMGQPNFIVLYQPAPQNIQNMTPVNPQVPQQFPASSITSRPVQRIVTRPPINNMVGNMAVMQRAQIPTQIFPQPANTFPPTQSNNQQLNNQPTINQLPNNPPANNQQVNNQLNNQTPINQQPNNQQPNNRYQTNPALNSLTPNNQYSVTQPPNNLPPNNQYLTGQTLNNLPPNNQYSINQPPNNLQPNNRFPINQPPNNVQPNNQIPNNVMTFSPYMPTSLSTRPPRQRNRVNNGRLNNRGPNRTQAQNMFPCQGANSTVVQPPATVTNAQNPVITIRLTPSQGPRGVPQNKPTPTVKPTTLRPKQNSQVNIRNYERCLNSCRDKKDRICASPQRDIQINPETLKGFPSMCHMACHNTFRANPIYGKIANGRCGKLRTRIQTIDKTKIRRDELKKSQYTIISNVPGTVVELAQ